jgi:hypothetical protein
VDWTSVVEIAVGVLAGGMISAYFARRGSQEFRREAENCGGLRSSLSRSSPLANRARGVVRLYSVVILGRRVRWVR